MARTSGQTSRSKKSTKSLRAVSRPRTDLTPTDPADHDGSEAELDVMEIQPTIVTRPASRQDRAYRHRKASSTARPATYSISKDQEYTFIREDLRRLLITAGVLTVVMIVLLFAIGR